MEDPGRAPKRRAVFLDRDGTLMYEVNFCRDPAQVRIVPGAAESLAELRRHGWLNIIVTNQSGIGRGCFTTADYQAVNAELSANSVGPSMPTTFLRITPITRPLGENPARG